MYYPDIRIQLSHLYFEYNIFATIAFSHILIACLIHILQASVCNWESINMYQWECYQKNKLDSMLSNWRIV